MNVQFTPKRGTKVKEKSEPMEREFKPISGQYMEKGKLKVKVIPKRVTTHDIPAKGLDPQPIERVAIFNANYRRWEIDLNAKQAK